MTASRTITWTATDITGKSWSADTVTIRKDDWLLLTASNGNKIDADGNGTFELRGGLGAEYAVMYDVPGEVIVTAMRGDNLVGSLTVVVIDVDLTGPIACEVGYRREKDIEINLPEHADKVHFSAAEPDLIEVSVKEYTATGATLYLKPLARGTPVLVARIGGEAGPIIAHREVHEFDVDITPDEVVAMRWDDENQEWVGEFTYTMSPLVAPKVDPDQPDVEIQLIGLFAGVTFENGEPSMSVMSNSLNVDADGNGFIVYTIHTPDYDSNLVCHKSEEYQDGVLCGNEGPENPGIFIHPPVPCVSGKAFLAAGDSSDYIAELTWPGGVTNPGGGTFAWTCDPEGILTLDPTQFGPTGLDIHTTTGTASDTNTGTCTVTVGWSTTVSGYDSPTDSITVTVVEGPITVALSPKTDAWISTQYAGPAGADGHLVFTAVGQPEGGPYEWTVTGAEWEEVTESSIKLNRGTAVAGDCTVKVTYMGCVTDEHSFKWWNVDSITKNPQKDKYGLNETITLTAVFENNVVPTQGAVKWEESAAGETGEVDFTDEPPVGESPLPDTSVTVLTTEGGTVEVRVLGTTHDGEGSCLPWHGYGVETDIVIGNLESMTAQCNHSVPANGPVYASSTLKVVARADDDHPIRCKAYPQDVNEYEANNPQWSSFGNATSSASENGVTTYDFNVRYNTSMPPDLWEANDYTDEAQVKCEDSCGNIKRAYVEVWPHAPESHTVPWFWDPLEKIKDVSKSIKNLGKLTSSINFELDGPDTNFEHSWNEHPPNSVKYNYALYYSVGGHFASKTGWHLPFPYVPPWIAKWGAFLWLDVGGTLAAGVRGASEEPFAEAEPFVEGEVYGTIAVGLEADVLMGFVSGTIRGKTGINMTIENPCWTDTDGDKLFTIYGDMEWIGLLIEGKIEVLWGLKTYPKTWTVYEGGSMGNIGPIYLFRRSDF